MSNESWNPEEEELLANYIADQVIGRASGRSEEYCLFNMPRNRYFIGSLRSAANENKNEISASKREFHNKLAPVAFGAEFPVYPQNGELKIEVTLQWKCYYRIFPTYQQQLDFTQSITDPDESLSTSMNRRNAAEVPEDPEEREFRLELEGDIRDAKEERLRQSKEKDALCPRFRRISCQATGYILFKENVDGNLEGDPGDLQRALEEESLRVQQIASADHNRLRTNHKNLDANVTVPDTALISESKYTEFKEQLRNKIPLSWKWDIQTKHHRTENATNVVPQENKLISVIFVNVSDMPDSSSIRENYLFDTHAKFQFINGHVTPFTLELAPHGFRYDRDLWGRGFNCAIEVELDSKYRVYTTTHTPRYSQKRYSTQTKPSAPFKKLAHEPIRILESIQAAMLESLVDWDAAEKEYQEYFGSQWEVKYKKEFNQDKSQFLSEIEQFKRGLELIRTNSDVRLAFQLTNETFRRAGAHPSPSRRKKTWRLFQIVFLVSQIPGIAALADSKSPDGSEREMVDIIYFPTGGGKTEAYLSVLVFHCFFDRLRGKQAGVTAWARFPLRLLTLQQTQRMTDIIGTADLVRREQRDSRLRDAAGFAVGYFVGQEGTPNELVDVDKYGYSKSKQKENWSRAQDDEMRQNWKRVIECPACRTNTIFVVLDEQTIRIHHRCRNEDCAFPNGNLPVYVIDNEIYRYLPSVVVGTIDKLAGLGNQRKLSLLFGKVTGYCTTHGYYNGKCCQKGCTNAKSLLREVRWNITGPTLFVQDELHLLHEGLGTFDGHYETFTQELLKQFGQTEPLKIIASSATIEAFKRQVEHLYGRKQNQARVFPSSGPKLGNSFYAKTEDFPQRLFCGILPHNKTIFNAVLELLQYYHETLQDLQKLTEDSKNPYDGEIQPGSSEWNLLIDNYLTSLSYFLAARDLSSIQTDMDTYVNIELEIARYQSVKIVEMTGSTPTEEVTRILKQIESPMSTKGEAPDAILATSMISHGVDVDRLNEMIFYGMPRQNAEYIQSSSRVGRRHVGIVMVCLHPIRERDRSHYAYFTKFHEFLGQLIEPVAINRWSKFSVKKTLPGLFMGVLLQLISNRSHESNPNDFYNLNFVKKQIASGNLSVDDFIPLLESAYGVVNPETPAEIRFQKEIRDIVQMFLHQIRSYVSQKDYTLVSDALIPRPMMSLRDVDEPVEIELHT